MVHAWGKSSITSVGRNKQVRNRCRGRKLEIPDKVCRARESSVIFRMEKWRRARKGVTGCKLDYARRNKCSGVRMCAEQGGNLRHGAYYAPLVVELDFYYELPVSPLAKEFAITASRQTNENSDRVNRISSPIVRERCVYKTKTKIKIFFPFFISIQRNMFRNERRNVRSLRREFLETDIRCPPCECPTTERKDRFSTLTIGTTQALSNRPSDQPFSFPLVSFAPSV